MDWGSTKTKYQKNSDGTWDVYQFGEWAGIAKQLPSGKWAFISSFDDVIGIGDTMEGAIYEALQHGGF